MSFQVLIICWAASSPDRSRPRGYKGGWWEDMMPMLNVLRDRRDNTSCVWGKEKKPGVKCSLQHPSTSRENALHVCSVKAGILMLWGMHSVWHQTLQWIIKYPIAVVIQSIKLYISRWMRILDSRGRLACPYCPCTVMGWVWQVAAAYDDDDVFVHYNQFAWLMSHQRTRRFGSELMIWINFQYAD